MGGRYPPMSPALPSYMRPTPAARVLRPGIVLITLGTLLLCGIMGLGIGIARFKEERVESLTASVGACQGFMIVASGSSFIYVLVHLIATIRNEPIGDVRPPKNRLHAACFIIGRLGLVLWMIGIITSAVVVARPGICLEASQECRLQVVDLVVACLSFIATGIILTALEACRYPFEVPEAFATGITCRVSSFGDDLIERSISAASSVESLTSSEGRKAGKKEMPEKDSGFVERPNSPDRPIPGEFPLECAGLAGRRLTPLLPMIPVSKSSAWSEEVRQLVSEDALGTKKIVRKADSAISLGSDTSSESGRSTSDRGSKVSTAKRLPLRSRAVTPSSSISNESRRSPLSRMRSAEFPDIIIQQELKFLPVTIPPPEQWSTTSRAAPASRQPTKTVVHSTPRPRIAIPPKSAARKHGHTLAPIVRRPAPAPIARRKTVDIKVPGAFVDYRPSIDDEKKLEEHAKKIQAVIEFRMQKSMPLVRANPIDSRTQYKEQRPNLQRANSTAVARTKDGETALDSMLGETGKVKPLRRLTLADISPKLEGIFGELMLDSK